MTSEKTAERAGGARGEAEALLILFHMKFLYYTE